MKELMDVLLGFNLVLIAFIIGWMTREWVLENYIKETHCVRIEGDNT